MKEIESFGGTVAFNTDYPVVKYEPMNTIQASVERMVSMDQTNNLSWLHAQRDNR